MTLLHGMSVRSLAYASKWRDVLLGLFEHGKCAIHNEKPSRAGGRVGNCVTGGSGANDVPRLEAFGAFEQIELNGLTLVERAVAVLLNRGEMNEDIFPRGALDETVSLRPVKPLDCSLLSHRKTPFPDPQELSFPEIPIVLRRSSEGAPPQEIR